MKRRQVFRAVVVQSFLISSPLWAAPPQYTITEVGSLGGRYNVGYAINNSGDIVGQASTDLSESPTYHAFLYDHSRNLTTDLGTLGGQNSLARAVNDCSKVAGNSDMDVYGVRHAALLSSRTDLGSLGGPVSDAFSINEPGDAVGLATDSGGQAHAALFERDGTLTDLGLGFATGINDQGDIAGDDATGAYLLSRAGKKYVGTLGGTTQARGLNNLAEIVGDSQLISTGRPTHAFLYDHGRLLDLGTLTAGYGNSSAAAINDRGEIVGRSDVLPPGAHQGVQHAFLYTDKHLYDLNTLIVSSDALAPYVTLTDAVGINSCGWIVANGYDSRGPYGTYPRVYLLTLKGRSASRDCAHDRAEDE
jgi:probable HAF family extracellular repeat protein